MKSQFVLFTLLYIGTDGTKTHTIDGAERERESPDERATDTNECNKRNRRKEKSTEIIINCNVSFYRTNDDDNDTSFICEIMLFFCCCSYFTLCTYLLWIYWAGLPFTLSYIFLSWASPYMQRKWLPQIKSIVTTEHNHRVIIGNLFLFAKYVGSNHQQIKNMYICVAFSLHIRDGFDTHTHIHTPPMKKNEWFRRILIWTEKRHNNIRIIFKPQTKYCFVAIKI